MAETMSKIRKSPAQLFALVFGVVYALTGIAGFVTFGLGQSILLPKETFIIFGVNPLHNGLHLAVGIVWILVSGSFAWSKRTNITFGIVFFGLVAAGVLNLLGFLGISGPSDPDNVLHFATAILALYFGTIGAVSKAHASKQNGQKTPANSAR